jgi:cellulose synthase/poly-beta-1,6-N-acetylglucosamine synthase-like glycosyltransferase
VLAALLLAGLVSASLATVLLFTRRARAGGSATAWSSARRLLLSLLATLVLAAVAGLALGLLGVTRENIEAALIGLVAVSLLWLPATRHWSARAHLAWSATCYVFGAYLAYMLWWTFVSHLGVFGTVGGLLLWVMEAFAAFLGVAYLWELCDALGREAWVRRVSDGARPEARDHTPFVSLQVPAYNEPPEMVIETVQSLLAVDYPAFEIIVIDDNTDDETLWRPVEKWCLDHGVKFAHLDNWPGYKSGALNFALRELTDPRAELIGVIDADYQLDPGFLRACAPLFADPDVAFIQSPQDYRDWDQAPYYRRLYYSYKYFFAVSQPSRNERDGAIFAGTMGLIRKQALERAGGWDEWCITEDAELSLRLLRDGWSGLHVDRSFGRGVMPLTFEALKGQRFRWCFGGIQILRQHWRLMVPGRPSARNRMDQGQRWAYLSGAVQWYGDLLAVIFFLFLLVGAGNVALGGGLLFRKLSGFLLAAIPMLAVLGVVRAIALLRRGTGASRRDALGAFMIWQSTSLVVARASVQGLFAKEAEFLRTPKTAEDARWWHAVRGNVPESLFAVLGLAGIVGSLAAGGTAGLITATLLVWPTAAFLSAPLNSLAAQRAVLPQELAERRRSEHRRFASRPATVTAAGLVAVAGTAVAAALLLAPAGERAVSPNPVAPARGQHPSPISNTSSPTASPSTPTTGPSTSPTSTPTSGVPTSAPTTSPTGSPPTSGPTSGPTSAPTSGPTSAPTTAPTSRAPTTAPTSRAPTTAPSSKAPASTPTSASGSAATSP